MSGTESSTHRCKAMECRHGRTECRRKMCLESGLSSRNPVKYCHGDFLLVAAGACRLPSSRYAELKAIITSL